MNNFFRICFFLFSALYGMENKKDQGWYREFLDNRKLGIPTSAIVGGGIAAGLTYLFRKNTFLSSLRAAEKIKYAPYFKFVGAGAVAGIGLYELLKRLTKQKKSDDNDEKSIQDQSQQSMRNSQIRQEDYNQKIKVTYMCAGNLYSLFQSKDGLKTNTANKIENILSESEIEKYSKDEFWFCSIEKRFGSLIPNFLRGTQYAAALYLINENQKESFKDMFKKPLCSGKSLVYELYTILPTSQEHLWCYALPVQSSVDHKGNKTYSPNISPEITEQTIDSYSFLLPIEDATNIKLDNSQIIGVDLMSRTNTQNVSGSSDYF